MGPSRALPAAQRARRTPRLPCRLYTEMVVDQTILHTPFLDKFLWCVPGSSQYGGSPYGAATRCCSCLQAALPACRRAAAAAV